MSASREPGLVPIPDPAEVFTTADLVLHLSRLRDRGPGSKPTTRRSLTRLAALTGIPRSTLHTYVSGATLPPAEALDAIVLALGCSPLQAAAWASAWERVADAARGGLSQSRSPHWSTLQRLHRSVSDWIAVTLESRRDDFDTLMISESAHIGADHLVAHVDMRITVRARRANAGNWYVVVPRSADVPHPEFIDATAIDQCEVSAFRFHEEQAAAVVEIQLGSGLLEGDAHTFEFRLHHGVANARARALWSDLTPAASTDTRRGFPRQGCPYALRVGFASPDDVGEVFQTYQSGPDEPVDRVRPLTLTRWGAAVVALEAPAAGLHGLGWSWRSGPSEPAAP